MVITRAGVVNRQRVDEIRVIGRATQGVRLVNLDEGDMVVDVARVISDDEEVSEVAEIAEGAAEDAAAVLAAEPDETEPDTEEES
jgi:DNA gyrase subunit A